MVPRGGIEPLTQGFSVLCSKVLIPYKTCVSDHLCAHLCARLIAYEISFNNLTIDLPTA